MHDATEAYCSDIPRPLKRGLSNYAETEAAIWVAICERYGIPEELDQSVKAADKAMCLAEARQIMSRPEIDESATGEAADVQVECWSPEEAKRRFLERFTQLTNIGDDERYGKWHLMLRELVNAIHADEGERTRYLGIERSYEQALAAITPTNTTPAASEREANTPSEKHD
jgi:hypothetical protein